MTSCDLIKRNNGALQNVEPLHNSSFGISACRTVCGVEMCWYASIYEVRKDDRVRKRSITGEGPSICTIQLRDTLLYITVHNSRDCVMRTCSGFVRPVEPPPSISYEQGQGKLPYRLGVYLIVI